jgi:hypothetical protein
MMSRFCVLNMSWRRRIIRTVLPSLTSVDNAVMLLSSAALTKMSISCLMSQWSNEMYDLHVPDYYLRRCDIVLNTMHNFV